MTLSRCIGQLILLRIASCNQRTAFFASYCRFQPDIFSLAKVQEVARNPQVEDSSSKIHLCMQVDPTIILMLFDIIFNIASSFCLECFLAQEAFYPGPGGGLQ